MNGCRKDGTYCVYTVVYTVGLCTDYTVSYGGVDYSGVRVRARFSPSDYRSFPSLCCPRDNLHPNRKPDSGRDRRSRVTTGYDNKRPCTYMIDSMGEEVYCGSWRPAGRAEGSSVTARTDRPTKLNVPVKPFFSHPLSFSFVFSFCS